MRMIALPILLISTAAHAFSMLATTNWSLIDGSANAPVGVSPQLPNILNGLTRPPWKVAGVDYGVGYPAGQSFNVIGVNSFAAACPGGTLAANVVTVTGSGTCTFDGWDFTASGGNGIFIADTFTGTLIVKNSKFQIGANQISPISGSVAVPTEVDITYSTFDSGGSSPGKTIIFVPGSKVVIQYNYISRWDNDLFRTNGTGVGNYTYKYNVISSGNYGSGLCTGAGQEHADQLHAFGGATQIVWQFNTSYQPAGDVVQGLPGQVNSFLRASDVGPNGFLNVEMGYNVWTAVGSTGHQLCHNTATGTTTTSGPPDVTSIDTTASTGLANTMTINGGGVYGTGIPTPGSTVTVSSNVNGVSGSLSLNNRATSNGTNAISVWAQQNASGPLIQIGGTTGMPMSAVIIHDNYFNYGGITPTTTMGFMIQCASTCAPGIILSQSITNNVNMFNGATIP